MNSLQEWLAEYTLLVERAGFDPSQPRDEEGQWTETGAGDATDVEAPRQFDARELKAVEDQQRDWLRSLTEEEREALRGYTQSSYHNINGILRGQEPSTNYGRDLLEKDIRLIKEALDDAPEPPPPSIVWRGVKVRKGDELSKLIPVNGEIQMDGFQSTTLNPDFANDWAPFDTDAILEIVPSRGALLMPLSTANTEYEYLLPHGARYKVLGRTKVRFNDGGQREVVRLKMLPVKKAASVTVRATGPETANRFIQPSWAIHVISKKKFLGKAGFDPSQPRDGEGQWTDQSTPYPLQDSDLRVMSPATRGAVEEQYEEWGAGIGQEERAAFKEYTSEGYEDINEFLRDPDNPDYDEGDEDVAEVRKYITAMQTALKDAPEPPPPAVVWRGVTGRSARVGGWASGLKPGDEVQMDGFQSTTIQPTIAANWATARNSEHHVLLEIMPSKGAYLPAIPGLRDRDEFEYLLPHGARYRVIGKSKVRGIGREMTVVKMRMLRRKDKAASILTPLETPGDEDTSNRFFQPLSSILLVTKKKTSKSGYDPNQPRDPAGSATGGQWTEGAGGLSIDEQVEVGLSDLGGTGDWKTDGDGTGEDGRYTDQEVQMGVMTWVLGSESIGDQLYQKMRNPEEEEGFRFLQQASQLPEYEGVVFRGMNVSDAELERLASSETKSLAWTSSSAKDREIAESFAGGSSKYPRRVVMEYRVKTGRDIEPLMHESGLDNEGEVVLLAASKYRQLGKMTSRGRGKDKTYHMVWEEIR